MLKVRVAIDVDAFKEVEEGMEEASIPIVLSNVKNNLPKYMPVDSGSMITQTYVDRDDEGYTFGVGSLIDDSINEIAIDLHEKEQFHYGTPGKSMREGMTGASNYKWIQANRQITSSSIEKQKEIYQEGYYEKKEAGKLSRYTSKYLENAVSENNLMDGV